jgi:hypothetical protein
MKLFVRELGGSDIVSFNLHRTRVRFICAVRKVSAMVIDFVRGFSALSRRGDLYLRCWHRARRDPDRAIRLLCPQPVATIAE